MKTKVFNILFNVWLGLALFFFIISFSINVPIYFRPLHTMCINPMNIVGDLNDFTGESYTFNDVVRAYNDVVNYCCFYTPFKAGKLLYPEADVLHFEDCRKLFTLDTIVMVVSFVSLIAIKIIDRNSKTIKINLKAILIAGIVTIVLPIVLGVLCALDFDKAFTIFHKIFFPGKDNWIFNPCEDHIILILPEGFFAVCAITIGVSVLTLCGVCIAYSLVKERKLNKLQIAQ